MYLSTNTRIPQPLRTIIHPIPCAFTLAVMGWLPNVTSNPNLQITFLGIAVCLTMWSLWLIVRSRVESNPLRIKITIHSQHYLQALAQTAVLLYWGWHWREVYHSAHLLLAQLIFAYAFDLLLTWSRRHVYTVGFSPLPIILSINLFLWFKPDWFVYQFVLIAIGLSAKQLVRWKKNGQLVHIFNPSALPLALCSVVLIATDSSDITWGQNISTTLNYAPQIYLVIFLVSLPGQWLFGVATMTMSAVVTMSIFGFFYFIGTGTYYFIDSYVPISVFLGMHLLFTDPSTAPRTEIGRIVYGVLYALSVITLYFGLGAIGAPRFYDKLLAVPLLNLLVRSIDKITFAKPLNLINLKAWKPGLRGKQRNLAFIGIWALVFMFLNLTQAIGDDHQGKWVQFWKQACAENRLNGCRHLGLMTSTYCSNGSGWACNEYGVLLQPQIRPRLAEQAFERACKLGFNPGCTNVGIAPETSPAQADPTLSDYRILLHRNENILQIMTATELYQLACKQGFVSEC